MKINKIRIQNFKKFKDIELTLDDFDILIGMNNSGKTSLMQAFALWQYCLSELKAYPKTKAKPKAKQVLVNSFYPVPTPGFLRLWHNLTDRWKPNGAGQEILPILVEIQWTSSNGEALQLGFYIRYSTDQTCYIQPSIEWAKFFELQTQHSLPDILYIPNSSGIDPEEYYMENGAIRHLIARGQPGRVLRNLLLRVFEMEVPPEGETAWSILKKNISNWFGVELLDPVYVRDKSILIEVDLRKEIVRRDGKREQKTFPINMEGSGFYQMVCLLSCLLGAQKINLVLLDEPDTHLHNSLIIRLMEFLRSRKEMQFFIASHSENVIKSVELPELLALKGISKPRRLSIISGEVRPVPDSSIANAEITALRLGNALVVNATLNPIILFLEGEDDLRILEAWANVLGTTGTLQKCVPTFMRGGDKEAMFRQADITFKGLRRLVPNVERFYLFDFDQKENTWHPDPNNKVCFEWKRKNIENYLFVPNAWLRAGVDVSGISTISFSAKLSDFVATFFENQTLILPKGQTYGQFSQGAFASNDGKQLLFGDNKESLYNQLIHNFKLSVPRSKVALNMLPSEIHQDVVDFFARLETLVANTTQSEI